MSNQIITDDSLKQYVDQNQAYFYIKEIFKNVQDFDPEWMIELRKIGEYRMEDGTTAPAEQSIAAQLLQFNPDNWQEGFAQWVAGKIMSTAPIGIGAFIAPAILNDRRANDKSVKQLVTICADFDSGNPMELLKEAVAFIRVKPTFVINSGGITAEGHAKLHVHWILDEPCDEPWKAAYIREQLAKRFGADESFKRIPQVIRIPGALYDKKGKWATTQIVEHNDTEISISHLEDIFNIDWDNLEEDSSFNKKANTKTAEERSTRLHQLHQEEVEAGRSEDTRFDRFSEYTGHQIRQARFGHQTEDEARQSTEIWVRDKMLPPWDPAKVDSEFKALLGRDKVSNAEQWEAAQGPKVTLGAPVPVNPQQQLVASAANLNQVQPPHAQTQNPMKEEAPWLQMFDASLLYAGEAPKERHLIENFLVHSSSIGLVADGGVGKTYVSLELALKAAAGPGVTKGQQNNFMGFEILEKTMTIVFTVEDGQHDIHRRLCAIDPDGSLRAASKGNCFIVPVQEQILEGLTLAEKDSQGNYGPSAAWKVIQKHIAQLRGDCDPDAPLLIIIDTYSATHHGDENNAIAVNEWFRSASQIKKFNGTLFITHHVRKTDPKYEIKTPADMKSSVRGSTAFMNALRTVYGIWRMPNGDSVVKELQREPGAQLFNMGILKNNTGIDWSDRSDPRYPDPMITLCRGGNGRLYYDDVAHRKRIDLANTKTERMEASKVMLKAAILLAVRIYAQLGWPLSKRSFAIDKAEFLPHLVNTMSRKDIEASITELIKSGAIKALKIKKTTGQVFDVPDGPYLGCQKEQRCDVQPNMEWSHYIYDTEHEEYVELEGAQHSMDLRGVK